MLFILSTFLFLYGGTLAFIFLLSFPFAFCDKFILFWLVIVSKIVCLDHTCSFFLAAASNTFEGFDLKLLTFVELVLAIELVLGFFLRLLAWEALGRESCRVAANVELEG